MHARKPEPPLDPDISEMLRRMGEVRDQHYLSRFYLDQFYTSGETTFHVFNKETGRFTKTPRSSKSVCYDEYYYARKTGEKDETSQFTELVHGQWESDVAAHFAPVLPRLIGGAQMTNYDKKHIARLIALVRLRGPEMRENVRRWLDSKWRAHFDKKIRKDGDRILDDLGRESGKPFSPETRKKLIETVLKGGYTLPFSNLHHNLLMKDERNLSINLCAALWSVLINKTKTPFVTSDNPVVVDLPKGLKREPYPYEVPHYFPISPQAYVEIHGICSDSPKPFVRRTLLSGSGEEVVARCNERVFKRAIKYVMSGDRAALEALVKKHGPPPKGK